MEQKAYYPREGSKANKAVKAIEEAPMSRNDLAAEIGLPVNSVDAAMATAMANGLVVRMRDKAGVLYFGLGDKQYDVQRFTLIDDKHRLHDSPVVRSVVTPSVKPTSEALAAANLFRNVGTREMEGQSATKAEDQHHDQGKIKNAHQAQIIASVMTKPKSDVTTPAATLPSQTIDFAAGLFSNGELVITAGQDTIKLCPKHTRELFDYLDKITDMIAA